MAMFDLKVGWINFHKRLPRQTKKMFGYGGFVCQINGHALFINKF